MEQPKRWADYTKDEDNTLPVLPTSISKVVNSELETETEYNKKSADKKKSSEGDTVSKTSK